MPSGQVTDKPSPGFSGDENIIFDYDSMATREVEWTYRWSGSGGHFPCYKGVIWATVMKNISCHLHKYIVMPCDIIDTIFYRVNQVDMKIKEKKMMKMKL